LLGRLHHYAIPAGERRTQFPGGHQERKIPRNDLSDDADRFTQSKGVKLCAGRIGNTDRDCIAFEFCGPTRHVMEQVGRQRDVGDPGDGARLAIIKRLQLGKFIGVLEDEIANLPD
jgi:hypothetical protein